MRYLSEFILRDLQRKMVFLSGPRQSGKSTLAKNLMPDHYQYLNCDILKDRKIIQAVSWSKTEKMIILDELHKMPRWKNYLKGVFDEHQNTPSLLVTGSAKLDTFRHQGDALTGRYFNYRLHPIDTAEALRFFKEPSPQSAVKKLLKTGGFPEPFLHPQDAERLRQDRFDLVLQEDLEIVARIHATSGIHFLIELLRDRVGTTIHYEALSQELGVSAPTVKNWMQVLERLFIIFRVPPYSFRLSNALKKESKFYFYDCAAASEEGARLENLVACSLLKHCHFVRDTLGLNYQLFHYRDKQKHEVDFIVAERTRPLWSIEVKSSKASFSPSLFYVHERLRPQQSLQLNLHLDRPQEKDGVQSVDLSQWLAGLGNI